MAKAEYRSAARSRRLITTAVVDLLSEKPLEKITVSDVVAQADVNRGTFYAHYKDVPDVLERMLLSACQGITDTLEEERRAGVTEPGALLDYLQQLLESDLELYRKILVSDLATPIMEQLRTVFVDNILSHVQESAQDRAQLEYAVRFTSGGVVYMYRDWLAGRLDCTLDELTARAKQAARQLIAAV
ncbi:MAG: TetR/AcrR family transcriptional regulator [Gemmiger sp.]